MNTLTRLLKSVSFTLTIALIAAFSTSATAQNADVYFPDRHNWETKSPGEVGMDADRIEDAVQYAIDHENNDPRDLDLSLNTRTNEPYNELVGPTKERGEMTGIIIKDGYIIKEWGEPNRVDMTFSVSKSFLSTTVGLAWDEGLINDVDEKVQKYMPTEYFNSEHNSKISWNHLLRQTSDWEGELFGKPDWADRPQEELTEEVINRERNEPGSTWKYNDVRVNLLALAALNVWREPLPKVLRERLMDPIGASNTWRWHGYENSWVTIDGQKMQSVSGGGHWGGGMFINAYDQARFGYLFLNDGNWNGDQLISEEWIEMARTPTEAQPDYGFMNFFLNHDKERLPSAPEEVYVFLGAGVNFVYIDQENDLVIVGRWISDYDAMDGVVKRVLDAIE